MNRAEAFEISVAMVAHHEAGHAAMLWHGARRLGLSLANASIISISVPTREALRESFERGTRGETLRGFCGNTKYDNVAFGQASGDTVAIARALAVQSSAGLVAEHRFLVNANAPVPTLIEYLAQTRDEHRLSLKECALEMKADRPVPDMDRMRWFADIGGWTEKQAIKKTCHYVYMPRIWRTIEALANGLSVQHKMTGAEAVTIMEATWIDRITYP